MKTLYSSTFISAIFAFLILLNQTEQPVVLVKNEEKPRFSNIIYGSEPATQEHETIKTKVEVFSQFFCPECRVFGQGVMKELQKIYANNEAVDLEAHLVVNPEDENEVLAFKASQCAGGQSKFWDMTHKIYELEAVNASEINRLSEELELDQENFQTCLNSEESVNKLQALRQRWEDQKIAVLPSIKVNQTILLGPQPLENIEREIRRQLNRTKN